MPCFLLTKNHIKMLKASYVSWDSCEYGAPGIDCKRPYGNSGETQILRDIAEAIGVPDEQIYDKNKEELIYPKANELIILHRELEYALSVVLRTGSFVPGFYEAPAYTTRWKIVTETKDGE